MIEIIKDTTMTKQKNADAYIAQQRAAVATNSGCGTSHYNLAVGLLGQKKFHEAETELLAAIECSPNLAEAYVQLGGICLQRGDLEGCLDFNKRSVHSRAGFAEGYGNIGFVYLQMGKIDEAITALEKAIRWNPKFIQALTTLGNAFLMKNMPDKCIEVNMKVIELEPEFAVAHNNLAIAYLQQEHFEMAATHSARAVELGYQVAPEILEEIKKSQ